MQCTEMTTASACFTDADGNPQTVVAHYEYGKDAAGSTILVATRYTDAAGTPIDTSLGTVSAGACPVASPDVEWEQRCDVQTDGSIVEFMCRVITTFAPDGTPTSSTEDFELDKTTPYTVTGTVEACGADCEPATPAGVLTTWGSNVKREEATEEKSAV